MTWNLRVKEVDMFRPVKIIKRLRVLDPSNRITNLKPRPKSDEPKHPWKRRSIETMEPFHELDILGVKRVDVSPLSSLFWGTSQRYS